MFLKVRCRGGFSTFLSLAAVLLSGVLGEGAPLPLERAITLHFDGKIEEAHRVLPREAPEEIPALET